MPAQLRLGDLIDRLTLLPNQDAAVRFDFCEAAPGVLDSWRGSYEQLAIDPLWEPKEVPTVAQVLARLRDAVGRTFTGYKGGAFVMDRQTPLWVSRYGYADETAVVGVLDRDYEVILETAYRDV